MIGSMVLLDLDGVVIFEAEPPLVSAREIILLHQNLGAENDPQGIPVVVLTHRSHQEAQLILEAAGLDVTTTLAAVIAAEDLFMAGIRHAPRRMFGRGLRRDLVLPILERRFFVHPSRIAFIDDRADNLEDLLTAGLGLAIHAPSYLNADRQLLMTFDLTDACSAIRNWKRTDLRVEIIRLRPRGLSMAPWRRTGLSTKSHSRHALNVARRVARAVRFGLSGRTQ